MSAIVFHNSTHLDDGALRRSFDVAIDGWAVGTVTLRVRYTRSADFSGTCFYADRRIHVNIGRHLKYPYLMKTHLARTKSVGRSWSKPLYTLEMIDGCDIALFIFMHELYHLLVKTAKRNTRQKESMCDRFAARHLVDRLGRAVRDSDGRPVSRESWDFQDLDGFVAAARDRRVKRLAMPDAPRRRAASVVPPLLAASASRPVQGLLFAP